VTDWAKIPKAPYYLEIREGKYRTSYRVNWRAEGHNLREILEPSYSSRDEALKDLKSAIKRADRRIADVRFGEKEKPKEYVRTEDLCDEIVRLKESKDPATYKQAELFFRLHIKPFLVEHCPYASELNATTWLKYKNAIRLKDPTVSLFNHWKFFVQLGKYAFEKGLIPAKLKLEYNEKREDFRERGLVISDDDFQKILAAATPKYLGKIERIHPKWRDRIVLQRGTGMRPGEVRDLQADRVTIGTAVDGRRCARISLRQEDTKTRQARSFVVTDPAVLEVLERRLARAEGPYLFPSETDPGKPMAASLNGWKAILRRAGVNPNYTPHDLRHTYLTKMFKTAANPALICFQAGLSLEEAQKTYLHFTADDTFALAESASLALLPKEKP
jgi:integrase